MEFVAFCVVSSLNFVKSHVAGCKQYFFLLDYLKCLILRTRNSKTSFMTLGYMPTVSFPGFWQPICSQCNARYRKRMLPCERTGKIPNFLTTESIHLKKKKQQYSSRIKTVPSYCLNSFSTLASYQRNAEEPALMLSF